MEPLFELAISLPPRGSRHLLHSLHRQLRAAIVEGRLQPGLRLPPTRKFASAYAVSRNTVVAAYDRLLSEGYLVARHGAGTYVADALTRLPERKARRSNRPADRRMGAFWRRASTSAPVPSPNLPRYDFRLGVPDHRAFPFDIWRRLSARAIRALSRAAATYGDSQGQPALREAIASHVSFTRAVACRPEDLVVTTGAQQAFDLLARILVTPGHTVAALEDPGYPPMRAAFAAAGARLVDVAVDAEGLVVERLPAGVGVICVTPSHQFPLGSVMSAQRRAALLEFARKEAAVIIEDDYDGEFRFGGRPLDALQTLDCGESVIYVGTFSKSLFPAIRLGYVVALPWLRPALVAAKGWADWHCDVLTQDTLAAFIAEGHLARHVRKMRRIYDGRRQRLLDGLERSFGRWLEPVPSVAGLHLTALARSTVNTEAIAEQARRHGVGVTSLGRYYRGRSARPGLVFGYGRLDEHAIAEGLSRLRRLFQVRRR